MPFKHLDDIEIVGHASIHVVSGDIGGEVWRINEKNHSRAIFVLTDEFLVITGSDFKTMKIVVAHWVVVLSDIVIKSFFSHSINVRLVFHGKHERRGA